MILMKKHSILLLIATIFTLASCTYQKNNQYEQDDVNENNEKVYGVSKDSAAAQLKNVYTADPANAKRVDALREKLYGAAEAQADSTKK
jgi:uncharacterized lipoprotein NlpE involved in copper resistance